MKKINIACIIDDDPIFVYGVKKVMNILDFCNSVLVFKNGQEALDNLKALISADAVLPDVIILDLNMPILDGWQFLEQFVKVPCKKKITIYIASSSVDPRDTLKAKSYEIVSDYIVKPVSLKKLEELMINLKKQVNHSYL